MSVEQNKPTEATQKIGDGIADSDFLGSKISPKSQAVMDSWEDPRGPEYSKAAVEARLAREAGKLPWYSDKLTVLSLAILVFMVGLTLGFCIL